jgi:acylphosphatase
MADLTRHYLISGRVQGVGYRAFTQRTALMMGLKGWVRNLLDRRVEAVAHGPLEKLTEFESRLRRGPSASVVETVIVADWKKAPTGAEFEVRKDGSEPCSES